MQEEGDLSLPILTFDYESSGREKREKGEEKEEDRDLCAIES